MTEGRYGAIAGMMALPAFWLFLVGLLLLEAMLPIHRQPKERGGRLVANFGLGVINALLFALLPLSTVLAAKWADDRAIGLMNATAMPAAAAFAITILMRSLIAYGLHVLAHRVPVLWRVHRIHHADTAVDLSTGFRHHPLELFVVAAGTAVAAIALGLSVPALIAYESLAVLFSLWTHANLRLPPRLETPVRWLFVTPAMHHVHHSADQPRTDSNYGELFSIWDRLFGTYCHLSESELRAERIGLGSDYDEHSAGILRQLGLPFRGGPAGPEVEASQPR